MSVRTYYTYHRLKTWNNNIEILFMEKELIEISNEDLEKKEKISEILAHQIITIQWKILMIFRRPDNTLYWYVGTQFTDIWHWKKQTINELEWFYKFDT